MARKTPNFDQIIREISLEVTSAVDFMFSELEEDWELAEQYYRGGTRLARFEGRSNVVKTEVRDAIRNMMPSVMRTLLHARKIVEYIPNHPNNAPWVEQQAEFVTQRFWSSGGYAALYNSVMDCAKLKFGVLKTYWEPNASEEYFEYQAVPEPFIIQLAAQPDVVIEEVEEFEEPNEDYAADNVTVLKEAGIKSPKLGEQPDIPLYNVSGYKLATRGRINICAVPPYEFFISRNATSIADACEIGVHGQRRSVTVQEAIDLGLEYEDWLSLDDDDPEQDEHQGSSAARRGYQKRDETDDVNIEKHRFVLTEVYFKVRLSGDKNACLYRFWLGGTTYVHLDHDKVSESPYDVVLLNPVPHSFVGISVADLTVNEQDTSTSVLRALIDNAHASNNPRPVVNPNVVNMDDVLSNVLGAPIRSRSGEPIQFSSVPFTGQSMLPILGYLDQDVQNKVGITKAAQGLDPDAMQSTDKNAVMNTIQTSQGQAELMVRNIIEIGLIPAFRKLLNLSLAYMDQVQLMRTKGTVIPININMFDPELVATPNVGLGTTNPMQKRAALGWVLQQQKEFMASMGMNNPFTSYSQIYNTLEDLAELDGVYDVSRYFKFVTPQIEQQLAKMQQQSAQASKEEGPSDPAKALVLVEQIKGNTKNQSDMVNATIKQQEQALEAQKAAQDAKEKQLDREQKERFHNEEMALKRSELKQKEKIEAERAKNDNRNPGEQATNKTGDSRASKTSGK